MSQGILGLHSHSLLERELKMPKYTVIVDEKFGKLFRDKERLTVKEVRYYKVPTLDFVNKGGMFKALME